MSADDVNSADLPRPDPSTTALSAQPVPTAVLSDLTGQLVSPLDAGTASLCILPVRPTRDPVPSGDVISPLISEASILMEGMPRLDQVSAEMGDILLGLFPPAAGAAEDNGAQCGSGTYSVKEKENRFITICALDGGGVRGVMHGVWSQFIESRDVSNRNMHDMFNFFSGTSAGALVALALTSQSLFGIPNPPDRAERVTKLFVDDGQNIFPPVDWKRRVTGAGTISSQYLPEPLEGLLQRVFGEQTFQHIVPQVSQVLITSVDALTHDPYLFNSKDPAQAGHLLWHVGRATSAAPLYFPACEFIPGRRLVDGGLVRNNPASLGALHAHMAEGVNPDHMIVLSLGTGSIKSPARVLRTRAGMTPGTAMATIDTLMDSCSALTHDLMRGVFQTRPHQYLRVNPTLTGDTKLDDITAIPGLVTLAEEEFERISGFFTDGPFRLLLERSDGPNFSGASGAAAEEPAVVTGAASSGTGVARKTYRRIEKATIV